MIKLGKKIGRAGPGPGQNFRFCFRPGQDRAEISISLSGRAELGPKFQFLFRVGPGQKFFLYFGPGPVRPEREIEI